jgi:uncharacterized protein YrrD
MRPGKDLIGKTIISVSDGRNLGVVKDLYLDKNLYWLAGIFLGAEGLFSRKYHLISRDDVVLFGLDVILVKDSAVVIEKNELEKAADWMRLDKLKGRAVDTDGGTKVGTIGDIYLDDEGRIVSFGLAKTYVEGPIAARGTIIREVVIDTGNEDGTLTIDLAKAERQNPVNDDKQ